MPTSTSRRTRIALIASVLLACTTTGSGEPERTQPRALSYGGGSCGKLEGGLALPCHGDNFEMYSQLACALGRNYLHPLAAATITDAYAELARTLPGRTFQLGELGHRTGGRFWPHKTHQSGVSADFFVPVSDGSGAPARLPVSPFDELGYGHTFSRDGRLDGLQVDFAALAAHLRALDGAGARRGVAIARVILTPDFHERLFRTAPWLAKLRPRFMKREAWVRHDEHYHVDFALPARERRPLRCDR